jgi:hypothetical protein
MNNMRVKEVVFYSGHGITANGTVSLKFKAPYSELINTINTMQMLNNDVSIKAKLPGEPVKKLGTFRIKGINIDGDGESVIKFDSLNTFVEVDNLNAIVTSEPFQVLMEANVELEEVDGTEV